MSIRLFDLLGVPDAATAAPLWPASLVSLSQGGVDDRAALVDFLQQTIEFTNVRAGVAGNVVVAPSLPPGQVTLSGDMKILAAGVVPPLFLRTLPDIAITLVPTEPGAPARCFFARDSRGLEVVIEALPVKVTLSPGLLTPAKTSLQRDPPNVPSAFDAGDADGFATDIKTAPDGTDLYFKARIHLTPAGDLRFEPSVPLSVKETHLLGLPSTTLWDMNLIPSLRDRDPFEWARHGLAAFGAEGGFGVRSIDFNNISLTYNRLHLKDARIVCEDVVFPFPSPLKIPVPTHGIFGIASGASTGDVYNLTLQPVVIDLRDPKANPQLELTFEKFLVQSGDPPTVDIDGALIWDKNGSKKGMSFAVDDKWTVRVGFLLDDANPLHLITIGGATVDFQGVKAGIGIGRLADGEPFMKSWELLLDFVVRSAPSTGPPPKFEIKSLDGDTAPIVLHDLGWSFGRLHTPTLKSPAGFELLFKQKIALIIEEMGFLEEPDGTPYFSFSGGVELGLTAGKNPKDALTFKRLRFPLSHHANTPPFKLDGLALALDFGKVKISGFGFITSSSDGVWLIDEWGFGIRIDVNVPSKQYSLAAVFLHGTRTQINPGIPIEYVLAAFELGYLPINAVDLVDIRFLLGSNLTPDIPPGGDERMPLFNWYKQDRNRIRLPNDRALGSWKVEDFAISTALGCGFALKGAQRFRAEILLFFAYNDEDPGILAVGELYLKDNPDPLAWVAIEYEVEKGKLGVFVGVDLTLSKLFPSAPSWFNASLTGTLYFGNLPWTFEIGKLADQRTWLTLRETYSLGIVSLEFVFAACAQIVDGGPKGFGVLFSFRGKGDIGIASLRVYGTFGVIVAAWKAASDTVSAIAWIDVGLALKLFWIFRFAADISMRISYIGKDPWFTTLSGRIEIKRSRFRKSFTFTFDRTWGSARSFDQQTIRGTLHYSEGFGDFDAVRLASPPLIDSGGHPVDDRVLSFNQLAAATPSTAMPADADIPILSTLATIALRFGHSVSNDMAVGPDSGDLGVQHVQSISVRYGLKSMTIRRRDRYGTTPAWNDFLTETQTRLDPSGNSSAAFTPALSMRWQLDSRVDGKLHSDQLLVNGSTAYTFTTGDGQSDEEALRDPLSAPCCTLLGDTPGEHRRPGHMLAFIGVPQGLPLPPQQQFSNQGAWWHWLLTPPPLAALPITGALAARDGAEAPPQLVQAFGAEIPPQPIGDVVIGRVDFAEDVASVTTHVAWSTADVPGNRADLVQVTLFLDAYDASGQVDERPIDLTNAPGDQTIAIAAAPSQGIARFVIRMRVEPLISAASQAGDGVAPKRFDEHSILQFTALQILDMAYVTREEAVRAQGAITRCRNQGGATGGAGKLAWLPNQLYEITVKSETRLSSATEGGRGTEKAQTSYFFTKGLPGFNAVETTGDELRPFVESTYPPNLHALLYRNEPAALAFTESMSTILVPRNTGPNDPDELKQRAGFMLNVDRIGSTVGPSGVTFPSANWFELHGGARSARATFTGGFFGPSQSLVRSAASNDPGRLRYERLLTSSPQCHNIPTRHDSAVLMHVPVAADGTFTSWEPQTTYRGIVRLSGGPYAHRDSFESADASAMTFRAESGGSATTWNAAAGILSGTSEPARSYALLGDATWMHLQAQVRLDSGTTAAGFALGVSADLSQSIVALVSTLPSGDRTLTLERRDGTVVTLSGPATLSAPPGPLTLRIVAFDDDVRASVGETTLQIDRGAVRAGQVALVSEQGNAQFLSLDVAALDLFNFDFATSRYRSFDEHIGSFDGVASVWDPAAVGVTPSDSVATWLAAHRAEIGAAMQAGADPQRRQALFTAFTTSQAVPLQERVDRLMITQLQNGGVLTALLVESPEPIPFSRDVRVAASSPTVVLFTARSILPVPGPLPDTPVPIVVLTNGDETAALILPDPPSPTSTPFGEPALALDFTLTRNRWRADAAATSPQAVTQGHQRILLMPI